MSIFSSVIGLFPIVVNHGSFLKHVLLAVLCRTALHLLCISEQGTDPFGFFKTKNKKKEKKGIRTMSVLKKVATGSCY